MAKHSDAIVYRTGDMGRMLEDGSLLLIGRMDRQVKINGQRLELGDVEAALTQSIPEHFKVFVDLIGNAGRKELAAYVSPNGIEKEGKATITPMSDNEVASSIATMRQNYPLHMVPKHLFSLKGFPITLTGKIDRQKLAVIGSELQAERRRTASLDGKLAANTTKNEHSNLIVIQRVIRGYIRESKGHEIGLLDDDDWSIAELGLDSVDAATLSNSIQTAVNRDIPVSALLKPGLKLSCISSMVQTASSVDKEASRQQLRNHISVWKQNLAASCGQTVFNTGATGFLGNELLHQLLLSPLTKKVIALVRGDDLAHAKQRIVAISLKKGWWNDSYHGRLEVWVGDLARDRLGLDMGRWLALFGSDSEARRVDSIIHNGAIVNWAYDYESLQASNVGSTHEFLKGLAQTRNPLKFVFVSGGYISPRQESTEEAVMKICAMPGYDQTKLVSEVMIEHFEQHFAQKRHRLSVIKPGFIVGSASDGTVPPQTGDAIWRLVQACVQMGCYSDFDAEQWIPIAGVDSVATAVMNAGFHNDKPEDRSTQPTKILNGLFLNDMWHMVSEMGFKLRPMKHEQWLGLLHEDVKRRGADHSMHPPLGWLQEGNGCIGCEKPVAKDLYVDGEINSHMAVHRSLAYLRGIGFFQIEGS